MTVVIVAAARPATLAAYDELAPDVARGNPGLRVEPA